MATRLIIIEAESGTTTNGSATGTENPAKFSDIPIQQQKDIYAAAIIKRVKEINPNKKWSEIQDEATNKYKKLIGIYNATAGKIGDLKSLVDRIVDKPVKDLKANQKSTEKKSSTKKEPEVNKLVEPKFVSPIRKHLKDTFPDIKFSASQVNFINKSLKPYAFFTLEEAVIDKESVIKGIVKQIINNELFSNLKKLYGTNNFQSALTSMFQKLGGVETQTKAPEQTEAPAQSKEKSEPEPVQPSPETPQQTNASEEEISDEYIKELPFQYFYDEAAKENMGPTENRLAQSAIEKIKTHINTEEIDPKTGRYIGLGLAPKQVSVSIQQAAEEVGRQVEQSVSRNILQKVTEFITSGLQKTGMLGEKEAQEALNEVLKNNKQLVYEGLFNKHVNKNKETKHKLLFKVDGDKFRSINNKRK
jgi:hypothetical protein